MVKIDIQDREEILGIALRNDFVILGEMHGSKQNAETLKKFLEIYISGDIFPVLAFEWGLDTHELESLNRFINAEMMEFHLPAFFSDSDGRVTPEHINLLTYIRSYNLKAETDRKIQVFSFESKANSSSEKDLAATLSKCRYIYPNTLILVETGNYHAKKYYPEETMASLLSSEFTVFSVLLKYLSGTILIEDEILDVTKAFSQQKSQEEYYDAVIEISFSEPAERITSIAIG